MAIPHPKQQIRKPEPKPEETQSNAPAYEGLLFAFLGAITAVVVGLGIYGTDPGTAPSSASRHPASVTEEWDARPYLPFGY